MFWLIVGLDVYCDVGVVWFVLLNMLVYCELLLVMNGVVYGIFFVFVLIVGLGDIVLCESLIDYGVIGFVNVFGFMLKGFEMDEYGICFEYFEEMCDGEWISVFVCMLIFNNLIVLMMIELWWCLIVCIVMCYGVYVIEDDVYGLLFEKMGMLIVSLILEFGFYCMSMMKLVLIGLCIGYFVMLWWFVLCVESVLCVSSWMVMLLIVEIVMCWIVDGIVWWFVEL